MTGNVDTIIFYIFEKLPLVVVSQRPAKVARRNFDFNIYNFMV